MTSPVAFSFQHVRLGRGRPRDGPRCIGSQCARALRRRRPGRRDQASEGASVVSAALPLTEDEIRAALGAREVQAAVPGVAAALSDGASAVLWLPVCGLIRVRRESEKVARITFVEAPEIEAQIEGVATGEKLGPSIPAGGFGTVQ